MPRIPAAASSDEEEVRRGRSPGRDAEEPSKSARDAGCTGVVPFNGGNIAAALPGNQDVLSGVMGVLQQTQQALARLGVAGPAQGIAGAAAAGDQAGLESVVSSLKAVLELGVAAAGTANAAQAAAPLPSAAPSAAPSARGRPRGAGVEVSEAPDRGGTGGSGAGDEVDEFMREHQLADWLGEALRYLPRSIRRNVIGPSVDMSRARNPEGVVVSRIKQALTIEQQMNLFIKVNDLGEGVIDRISTLSPEVCELTLETGIKIIRANNPSGVAMKRITEAMKKCRNRSSERIDLERGRLSVSPGRHGGKNDNRRSQDDPGGLFDNCSERDSRSRSGRGRGRPRSRSRSRSVPRPMPTHLRRSGPGQSGPVGPPIGSAPPPQTIARGPPSGSGSGNSDAAWPEDVKDMVSRLGLEQWCGEVLRRLSLYQRQSIDKELNDMRTARNPSGVVMSKIKQMISIRELTAVFVDINDLDKNVEDKLWSLTDDQRAAVIAPGIFLQNVRNASVVVLSRIRRVEEDQPAVGNGAPARPHRGGSPNRGSSSHGKGMGKSGPVGGGGLIRSGPRGGFVKPQNAGGGAGRHSSRRHASSSPDYGSGSSVSRSRSSSRSRRPRRRRRRRHRL